MNYLSHKFGSPLCRPMYYLHPNDKNAYKYKRQYYFGSQLIVAPVVTKLKKRLQMAKTNVWLPEGQWTDIFTGRKYTGGKVVPMMRGLSQIPALAKEGAIIPLCHNCKDNDWSLPKELSLMLFSGSNEFELYEDDGHSKDYQNHKFVKTKFGIKNHNKTLEFVINKPKGDLTLLPEQRKFVLDFKDILKADVKVFVNNNKVNVDIKDKDNLLFSLKLKNTDSLKVVMENIEMRSNGDPLENARNILNKYQKNNIIKMLVYKKYKKITDSQKFFDTLKKDPLLPSYVKKAVEEVMI